MPKAPQHLRKERPETHVEKAHLGPTPPILVLASGCRTTLGCPFPAVDRHIPAAELAGGDPSQDARESGAKNAAPLRWIKSPSPHFLSASTSVNGPIRWVGERSRTRPANH